MSVFIIFRGGSWYQCGKDSTYIDELLKMPNRTLYLKGGCVKAYCIVQAANGPMCTHEGTLQISPFFHKSAPFSCTIVSLYIKKGSNVCTLTLVIGF